MADVRYKVDGKPAYLMTAGEFASLVMVCMDAIWAGQYDGLSDRKALKQALRDNYDRVANPEEVD